MPLKLSLPETAMEIPLNSSFTAILLLPTPPSTTPIHHPLNSQPLATTLAHTNETVPKHVPTEKFSVSVSVTLCIPGRFPFLVPRLSSSSFHRLSSASHGFGNFTPQSPGGGIAGTNWRVPPNHPHEYYQLPEPAYHQQQQYQPEQAYHHQQQYQLELHQSGYSYGQQQNLSSSSIHGAPSFLQQSSFSSSAGASVPAPKRRYVVVGRMEMRSQGDAKMPSGTAVPVNIKWKEQGAPKDLKYWFDSNVTYEELWEDLCENMESEFPDLFRAYVGKKIEDPEIKNKFPASFNLSEKTTVNEMFDALRRIGKIVIQLK